MFPRTRHKFSLSELASLLAHSLNGGKAKFVVEARTVAAHSEDQVWYNVGTTVRLLPRQDWVPAPRRIDLDRVLLLASAIPSEAISSVDDLCNFISGWRREVGNPDVFPFQRQLSFTHYPARNRWMQWPGWVFELYEQGQERLSHGGPSGPFLHSHHDIFAESIEALVADWLKVEEDTSGSTLRHTYHVIVPDLRAHIADIRVDAETITISTESLPNVDPLFCASRIQSSEGVARRVQKVEDGRASFAFPNSTTDLSFWLLNEEGEWFDRYAENGFSQNPHFGVLTQPREESDPSFTELKAALMSGEDNQNEFKPYIEISKGSDKAQQILKTAAAFANTHGGTLYIGVSDELEPVGVYPSIKRDYGSQCKGDNSEMERAYVRDIRKLISEGVDPNPVLTFEWVSFAQHRILTIHVVRGLSKPYILASSGDIYVRTGGNNRKLRQSDYPLYFQQPQPPSGLLGFKRPR